MTILLTFLATSFWCIGVNVVAKNICYEVLDFDLYKEWDSFDRVSKLIMKPLFACPYCMASIHGTASYFLFLDYGFFYWIPFCICLCGFNYFLTQFFVE